MKTKLKSAAILLLAGVLSPLTSARARGSTDNGTRHAGPMAQDFETTFGLNGGDDKHISVVDENGVALAAIQSLNQKPEARSRECRVEKSAGETGKNDAQSKLKSP